MCEGPYANIISIVKPLVCNISINPFGISKYSNLSYFQDALLNETNENVED